MVSKFCSRSQGQPPGARSRAINSVRRSNFAAAWDCVSLLIGGNISLYHMGLFDPIKMGS